MEAEHEIRAVLARHGFDADHGMADQRVRLFRTDGFVDLEMYVGESLTAMDPNAWRQMWFTGHEELRTGMLGVAHKRIEGAASTAWPRLRRSSRSTVTTPPLWPSRFSTRRPRVVVVDSSHCFLGGSTPGDIDLRAFFAPLRAAGVDAPIDLEVQSSEFRAMSAKAIVPLTAAAAQAVLAGT